MVVHRLACLILMAGLALAGLGLSPATAQTYSFSNVSVQGNVRIETGTILTYAGISRGQSLSAGELNDALQRIRDSGLFESVDGSPQGNTLVISVVEYPTINRINFEGNSKFKDDELAAVVKSQSRRVYNPAQAEQDVAAITALYADSGRINATVSPRIIRQSENRVDLVFEVFEGGLTEIERLGFVGNTAFSDRRLRSVLQTKQAGLLRAVIQRDTFSADRLELDKRLLTDFYNSRGYADFVVQNVDVQLTRARDAYLVTYNVQEGQKFSFGNITVSSDLPEVNVAEFQRALRLRSGVTYSPTLIDTDISRLEKLALDKGLNFVQVEPRITRDDRNLRLNVEFALVRGPRIFVERIDIEGNNTTLDRVVRNQFRVVEGDPFNPRSIRESAERIRALGYFSNADVKAREGTSPDQVIIDVNVTEQPTGSLSFGANFTSDTGLGLVASFKERNFLGRGQTINAQISTAKTNQIYSLDFSEPNLLGRDLAFGMSFNYKVTNQENAVYNTRIFDFRPNLSFPVSENGRLTVGLGFDYTELSNYTETNPFILADVERGGLWATSVSYQYSYDTRRTGLDPNAGALFRFGQEFGVGDDKYIKTTASLTGETKVLNEEVTLRATVEGSALTYLDGNSRIVDRSFLGSRLMRGFAAAGIGPRYCDAPDCSGVNDAMGGNYYAVARLEAEFPLGLPEEYGITGGAFFDYGSLWGTGIDSSDPNYANILYDDYTPRSVAGLSLFWKTPIGPLRFNFSQALDSQQYDETKSFDVTISTSF